MANSCSLSCTLTVVSITVALFAIFVFFTIPGVPDPPQVDRDNWFGKDARRTQDETIKSFQISVSQQTLDDLKHRLQNTRYFEGLQDVQWEYGTNTEYLKQLVDHWINKYDWRTHEKLLNSFPHYQTNIDGLKVHFLHVKPEVKAGQTLVPIMFIHGWPGSFYEFYKVIPLLAKESVTGKFAYEIICPSLPGFGFSEAAHKPGMTAMSTAVMFSKLMSRLGHQSYYVQGGDWGSDVSRAMALAEKSHVKGIHLNMFLVSAPYGLWSYLTAYFTFPPHEHKKVFPLKDWFLGMLRETGYFHLQATRPDTVGFALGSSPAGLAAYIVEKFFVWSGCSLNESSACLDSLFTKDELLTNVMIYWTTNSITSSLRYYKENIQNPDSTDKSRLHIDVPSGLAEYPSETIFTSPKPWALATFPNNVHYSVLPKGGHFAAFEQPEIFTKDVTKFVEKVEAMSEKKDK